MNYLLPNYLVLLFMVILVDKDTETILYGFMGLLILVIWVLVIATYWFLHFSGSKRRV
jgi:hypothetical protein